MINAVRYTNTPCQNGEPSRNLIGVSFETFGTASGSAATVKITLVLIEIDYVIG